MVRDNSVSKRKTYHSYQLPAHTKDVLQPLDAAVFKSLEDIYISFKINLNVFFQVWLFFEH